MWCIILVILTIKSNLGILLIWVNLEDRANLVNLVDLLDLVDLLILVILVILLNLLNLVINI